jgi:hypothetical protein
MNENMSNEATVEIETDRALPADERPFVTEPFHTADLPLTPTRDRNLPAHLWVECPTHLASLGEDFGATLVAYKRQIGACWLLWRAGPAVHADARYGAVDRNNVDDITRFFTYRLFPDGSGFGVGPDGVRHERFRTWKESLRDSE